MRPEDLVSSHPSAEEVAKSVSALPRPAPEALDEVRAVLERSRSPGNGPAWPPFLEEARARLDVRTAPPATSHRGGVIGPALVSAKRSFRLVAQPFINEVLRRQVEFNEAILNGLAQLHEQLQAQARAQALWRADMEERMARLEAERSERGGSGRRRSSTGR